MEQRMNQGYVITDSIRVGEFEISLAQKKMEYGEVEYVTWFSNTRDGQPNYNHGNYNTNPFNARKNFYERVLKEVKYASPRTHTAPQYEPIVQRCETRLAGLQRERDMLEDNHLYRLAYEVYVTLYISPEVPTDVDNAPAVIEGFYYELQNPELLSKLVERFNLLESSMVHVRSERLPQIRQSLQLQLEALGNREKIVINDTSGKPLFSVLDGDRIVIVNKNNDRYSVPVGVADEGPKYLTVNGTVINRAKFADMLKKQGKRAEPTYPKNTARAKSERSGEAR